MRRGERTRDRILDAAAECFAARGYDRTTVRAICAGAGVNVAAVNYFFGSKEKLYFQTVERIVALTVGPLPPLADRVRDDAGWRAAVRAWTERMLRVMLTDRAPESWAARMVAHERHQPSPAMSLIYERLLVPIEGQLHRLVRMAFPRDPGNAVVRDWADVIVAQVLHHAFRAPPWDRILGLPPAGRREAWIRRKAGLIAGGVTARLRFRRFVPAEGGMP